MKLFTTFILSVALFFIAYGQTDIVSISGLADENLSFEERISLGKAYIDGTFPHCDLDFIAPNKPDMESFATKTEAEEAMTNWLNNYSYEKRLLEYYYDLKYNSTTSVELETSKNQTQSFNEPSSNFENATPLDGGEIKTLSSEEFVDGHNPNMSSTKAGTTMTISGSSTSVCVGSSYSVTWTYNDGDGYAGTAQWSENGSTWYNIGSGSGTYTRNYTMDNATGSYRTFYGRILGNTGVTWYTATNRYVYRRYAPPAPIVSGGGTYCASATITAKAPCSGEQTYGTGTTTTRYSPLYGYYNYSRSVSLIKSDEISCAGGGGGTIYGLYVYVGTSNSHTFTGIQIRLSTTTATTAPTTFPTGTLVWSGNYTFSSTGWRYFAFTTPYTWSSGNLLIEWRHGSTSWSSNYPYFNYTDQSSNLQTYGYSDASMPTTGTNTTQRPNYLLNFQVTSPTTYWQNTSASGTSTATPSTSQSVSSSGTYYFRSRSNYGCWGGSDGETVTVDPQTNAGTMSVTNTSFCAGGSTQFSASGTVGFQALEHQWNGTSGTWNDWSDTNPYTWSTSTIGTLYVRSRAKSGVCATAYSSPVSATVVPDPSITTQPVGATICSGATHTMNVSATGGISLSYQWYKNGSVISGATGTSYAATTTGNYYCRVSSTGSGCDAINSNTVTVTVNADPSVTTQPVAGTICPGGTHTLSIGATGG
ncbi:MAG: immunoglobulin domain-containing protein, partial [Bacteroidales bacterium]|nr:immunoglobulin domain-containing protein [Bacteroidales bacterium]